ncbi:MAG TPA: signal peptidase I [Armatimonadota bacterium]|nr:signal peptidase I [Armatimonadota bacterium]
MIGRAVWMWCAVLAGLGLLYAAQPYRIGFTLGHSMDPTLRNGQPYLLQRAPVPTRVSPGDVVVFDRGGLTYVKRVLAVPGDTFYVVKFSDGDESLVMDWQLKRIRGVVRRPVWRDTLKLVRRRVPPGTCYVVGDHLAVSVDSRSFGPIPVESIRGKVLFAPAPRPFFQHVASARSLQSRS